MEPVLVITPAELYCKVYKNQVHDELREDQMNLVLQYFADRGYNIRRVLNPATEENTFYWYLTWN